MRSERLLALRTRYAISAGVAFAVAAILLGVARGIATRDTIESGELPELLTLLTVTTGLHWLAILLGIAFTFGAIAARIVAETATSSATTQAPEPSRSWYE